MRKITLLFSITILALLSACGTQAEQTTSNETITDNEAVTTESVTEKELYTDSLPEDLNFNGYEFIVSSPAVYAQSTYNLYLDPEEQNGDIVNDTAYQRNIQVEERLNVAISYTPGDDFNVSNKIRKSVLAGDRYCDLALIEPQYWDDYSSLISDHCLYDLRTLPYLTLDAPYYFADVNDTFTVNNRLYAGASYYGNSALIPFHMVYNATLLQNLDLESPYSLVKSGKWTFDAFTAMCKDTYADLNGDGNHDVYDRYGYMNEAALTYNMFWGFGMNVLDRDSDGNYVPNLLNERVVSAYQKILTFHESSTDINDSENYSALREEVGGANPFVLGNTLFTTTGTGNLHAELRDVAFNIGITPYPKYDETQESYHSNGSVNLFCIPSTVSEVEAVCAITEALSCASKNMMEPVMINTYIEQKVLRDEESVEIFEMLLDTFSTDMTMYYKFTTDAQSISPILFLANCKSDTVVSQLTKLESSVTKKMEKYFSMFYED